MGRRVAVTGVGVVSSIGVGAEEFWRACLAGETRVEPVPVRWLRYADLTSRLWSPLPELDLSGYAINRIERLQQDGTAILAMASAFQALSAAGLAWEPANVKRNTFRLSEVDPERVSVAVGTGIGGVSSLLANYQHHVLARPKAALRELFDAAPGSERVEELLVSPSRMNQLAVPMAMPNGAAGALSIKFSVQGPSHTFCSACASGTVAVGHAFRSVRSGRSDLALAGGTELMDDAYGGLFRAFDLARTLVRDCTDAERANRPFDRSRSGFLFSQGGAAVLLLEELEHARRRGAPLLAEVAGFGESSDAHNVMALDPSGHQIARAVTEALADAELTPAGVDYVNAHGTGTEANDSTEAEVISRLFVRRPWVSSTKALLGHTLGASGALEAAVTVLSLRDQTAHPCRNLEEPIADLEFVRSVETRPLRAAVSQSFAFGGHNAALVFRALS